MLAMIVESALLELTRHRIIIASVQSNLPSAPAMKPVFVLNKQVLLPFSIEKFRHARLYLRDDSYPCTE